jgi:transposase
MESCQKEISQKIIHCLGRVDKLPTDGTIEKIIVALDRFASQKRFSSLSRGVVIDDLNQENIISKSYDFGEMFLIENLLKILSFTDIFKSIFDKTDKKRVSWDNKFLTATTSLLGYHLHSQISVSERSTYRWYKNQLFLKNKPNLSLMDFYRTLDILIANKDTSEKQCFEKNKTLFSKSLDLILFDTTSIYYYDGEEKINNKSILQYSYSKDSQESLKQLIVGVLMSDEEVPIAHEVFKGNQSDLKSFK